MQSIINVYNLSKKHEEYINNPLNTQHIQDALIRRQHDKLSKLIIFYALHLII
jgi:hypothetical protein